MNADSAAAFERAGAIRELPERVAAQIAAGEVIERPAAVLKELLENALDAGSRRIAVEIAGGGQERIAVHDDGRGIAAEELALAFRRHATSKLETVEDLGRLTSYGFRGEALPAIAAAAGRLTLTTRTLEAEAASTIEFDRGAAGRVRPAARSVGATVEVIDLFAGQPARRAFLAGARAERAALLRAATDAALANPGCSLRTTIDGRTPLDHEAPAGIDRASALREALGAVFDHQAAQRAIWLEAQSDRTELSLDGFAGSPDDARRTRERIRLFVNGRPVHDRRLSYAVQEAYRDWLGAGEFPLVVARLRVPPESVDVNIHPAKTEVKLREPDAAFALLGRTIREALHRDRYASPRRLRADRDFLEEPTVAPTARRVAAGRERQSGGSGKSEEQASLPAVPRQALPLRRSEPRAVAEPALSREFESVTAATTLPPLRMVGQLHRTFIIAEGPEGLVLVDQHAAHERVLYERLLSDAAGPRAAAVQPLLDPLLLSLDAEEAATFDAAADRMISLGFEADHFGERALRLRAVPEAMAAAEAESLVRGLLADLSGYREEPERFDRAAASAACHGSVRRGQVLDTPAMAALLRDLERCDNPHSCPHGRPTLVEISADDVLRQFRRR